MSEDSTSASVSTTTTVGAGSTATTPVKIAARMPPVVPTLFVVRITATVLAVIGVAYLLVKLGGLLVTFALGVLVAIALDPAVRLLMRRGLGRGPAVLALVLGTIVALLALGAFVVPNLVNQTSDLAARSPDLLSSLRENHTFATLDHKYALVRTTENYLQALPAHLAGSVDSVVASLLSGVLQLVVMVTLITFLLLRGGDVVRGIATLFPAVLEPSRWRLVQAAYTNVGTWAGGTLLDGVVGAAALGLAMVVLGVPFVLPVMLIYVVLNFVPAVGSVIGSLPAIVIALLNNGAFDGLTMLAFVAIYQQLDGAFIYNAILGRTMRLSPFYVFIAVLVGAKLLGTVGAILAVPITGVVQVALVAYLEERDRVVAETELPDIVAQEDES